MAIMLYLADLDATDISCQSLQTRLTPTDLTHGGRLAAPHRRRWLVGQALLRALLGLSDSSTDFATTANGKPFLDKGPHFSKATSGNLILIGVSRRTAIGVDIERMRDVDFPENWAAAYPSLAAMRRRDDVGESRSVQFLRAWTRLEAITKRDSGRLGQALEPAQPGSIPLNVATVIDIEIGNGAIAAACCGDLAGDWELNRVEPGDILRER